MFTVRASGTTRADCGDSRGLVLGYAVQPDSIHFARLTNQGSRLHCAGNCSPNHSFPGSTDASDETMN